MVWYLMARQYAKEYGMGNMPCKLHVYIAIQPMDIDNCLAVRVARDSKYNHENGRIASVRRKYCTLTVLELSN